MRKGLKNGLIQDLASHIDAVRHDSNFTSKGPRTEKRPSQLFFSKHLNIQLLQITFLKHLMIHHFDSSFTTFKKIGKNKVGKSNLLYHLVSLFITSTGNVSIKIQLLLDR